MKRTKLTVMVLVATVMAAEQKAPAPATAMPAPSYGSTLYDNTVDVRIEKR
jgi:hypothetical protein